MTTGRHADAQIGGHQVADAEWGAPERSAYDHPEWEAFVRAIRAGPDDDMPRLAAADWLEEHGERERAELIRVQCALARRQAHFLRTGVLPFDAEGNYIWPDQRAIEASELHLLRTRIGLITQRRPEPDGLFHADYDDGQATMVRGFCVGWRGACARWLALGPKLCRREPVAVVHLADKIAYWHGGAYCFYREGRPRPSTDAAPVSAVIPDRLWGAAWGLDRLRPFDSPSAAGADLAALCLAYGFA